MCNVVTKIVIAGAIMFGVLSCGNNDRDAANNLLTQAEESIETRQYSIAVALLDSIDNCYPREIDVRRKAMNLRPKAIEGKTLRDIEQNDSLIAVMQGLFKEMESNFVKISNPQLVEPYIVAKKANKSILDKNGIQARITPEGDFYVISSLQDGLKHTSVSLVANGETVTTATVPYDGDRNYRSSSSEMITFVKEECDTLGEFACAHKGASISVRFNGNRNKSIKLTKDEIEAFAMTYKYSEIITRLKAAMRRGEKLEQLLALSRDQIARTTEENRD